MHNERTGKVEDAVKSSLSGVTEVKNEKIAVLVINPEILPTIYPATVGVTSSTCGTSAKLRD